jgi:hypothetical protein
MELPLRDIHLPGPISWWPPAFGWWIIFGIAAICICLLALYISQHFKPTLKKEATKVLDYIEKSFHNNGNTVQCLSALSALLRRISLQIFSSDYAGVTGEAWLHFLDKRLKEPEFSQGAGRILLYGPYQPEGDPEMTLALIHLCRKWVNSL